ncbi:hypothetical protein AB3662_08350 [Sorangium cellulosum]|uniref:hypothetical protein n=1 Tax=Sorangium cellulosum TaxID=56 RepID=UPI003D9A25BB
MWWGCQDPSLLRQEFVGNDVVGPGAWALMMNEKYEIPCEKGGLWGLSDALLARLLP